MSTSRDYFYAQYRGARVKNGGIGKGQRLGRVRVRVSDPDKIYMKGRQHPRTISPQKIWGQK